EQPSVTVASQHSGPGHPGTLPSRQMAELAIGGPPGAGTSGGPRTTTADSFGGPSFSGLGGSSGRCQLRAPRVLAVGAPTGIGRAAGSGGGESFSIPRTPRNAVGRIFGSATPAELMLSSRGTGRPIVAAGARLVVLAAPALATGRGGVARQPLSWA